MTETAQESKPKQKRNRLILNCLSCKRRKIKCDRQLPCKQCIKAGFTCEYQQPEWIKNHDRNVDQFDIQKLGIPGKYNQSMYQSELQELKDKIRQLEASQSPAKRQKLESQSTTQAEVRSYKYDPQNNPTFIGINPYADDEETINFYKGYNSIFITAVSRRYNSGPFSWLSIMKKDPALLHAWKYLKAQRSEHVAHLKKISRDDKEPECTLDRSDLPKETHANGEDAKPDRDSQEQDHDKEFHAMVMDRDGFTDYRLYGNLHKRTGSLTKENLKRNSDAGPLSKIATMNKHGISLGLTVYEGTIDKELQLIEKISIVLPNQKVIWKLVNKFFAKIYPFMPIIDETDFKNEISRILGAEGYDETAVELKVEKRLDFAHLGVLLVMLRITYLSLFLNRGGVNESNLSTTDPSEEAQELKYLLSNPVNITLVNIAQECLEQFDFLRRTSFTVLQCAFVLKLYRMYAPEDGDGADEGDAQTYNAMLIQMAYSMGINREPTHNASDEVLDDLKTNNIQRKIWSFLVRCDLAQAYGYGNPVNIDKKYYDTALPFYEPGNENIRDIELEKHVVGSFSYFERYYDKLLAILDTTLDIQRQIKLADLTAQITEFEVFLHSNFGTLRDFMKPFDKEVYQYPFVKIMKCKNYINMRMFVNVTFYHLFLHYEEQGNTEFAYFYLKKILASQVSEFFPSVFQLIGDSHVNFGDVADLILNPTIESMIHKVSDLIFAILARLNASIYQLKRAPDHEDKLKSDDVYRLKLLKLTQAAMRLRKVCDFFVMAMSKLSQRYFYAWRVTKAHTFVMKSISSDDFYAAQDKPITFLELSEDQLTELTNLIGTGLHKNCRRKRQQQQLAGETPVSVGADRVDVIPASPVPTTPLAPTPAAPSPPAPGDPSNSTDAPSTEPVNLDAMFDDFGWEKDFNIVSNPEIDYLWLQMAQMKNDSDPINSNSTNNTANGNYNANSNNYNGSDIGHSANPFTPASVLSYNSDGEHSRQDVARMLSDYELFSTLPFERFFGSRDM
ncbi:Multidrug resistance regulator 1 [Candida viswanathii]|uniref:Multidrug resistance regulator 1 n=1 Tax=Candida viswanathii TaxID=5486 RepID=A0A367YJP8_9ASCO|nr:Multidrug resistance regulator 1 [Candida viswanathii]